MSRQVCTAWPSDPADLSADFAVDASIVLSKSGGSSMPGKYTATTQAFGKRRFISADSASPRPRSALGNALTRYTIETASRSQYAANGLCLRNSRPLAMISTASADKARRQKRCGSGVRQTHQTNTDPHHHADTNVDAELRNEKARQALTGLIDGKRRHANVRSAAAADEAVAQRLLFEQHEHQHDQHHAARFDRHPDRAEQPLEQLQRVGRQLMHLHRDGGAEGGEARSVEPGGFRRSGLRLNRRSAWLVNRLTRLAAKSFRVASWYSIVFSYSGRLAVMRTSCEAITVATAAQATVSASTATITDTVCPKPIRARSAQPAPAANSRSAPE